jgi:hypothetical protein
MSTEQDKFKHSKRMLKDDAAVKKQVDIAKRHGVPVTEPNKFAKRHAMNCGDSNCVMCGNPRKFWGERTIQEQRLFQDVDQTTDKHSNGLPKDIEE